jgi:hypothetical protein
MDESQMAGSTQRLAAACGGKGSPASQGPTADKGHRPRFACNKKIAAQAIAAEYHALPHNKTATINLYSKAAWEGYLGNVALEKVALKRLPRERLPWEGCPGKAAPGNAP